MLEAFDFFARWESRLVRAAARHAPLQELADIAGEVIGNPMLVTVPDGSVLAFTTPDCAGLPDPIWDYATEHGSLHPSVRNDSFFTPKGDVIESLTVSPTMVRNVHSSSDPALISYAIAGGETLLGVGVKQVNESLVELNRQLLPIMLEYFVQAKELATSGGIGRTASSIVTDAIDGAALHPDAVMRFERNQLAPPYRILSFEHVTRVDEFAAMPVLDAVDESSIDAVTLMHGGSAYVLIAAGDATQLVDELRAKRLLDTRRVGVSAPLVSLGWLRAGRQQVQFCLNKLGNRVGVAFCEEYAYSYLVDLLRDNPLAMDFLHPAIGLLERYDSENNTDLAQTLGSYIRHGRSLVDTAEALCVHKNTLKYRMGRIREIAHIDTANPSEMDYLALSFKLHEQQV